MKNPFLALVEGDNRDDLPKFQIGDTVDVHQRILEGQKERVQVFSGVVIARRGEGVREMFTVEVEDFTGWNGQERVRLFSDYIAAIERGDIIAPLSEPWYRAHRYVTNDDLYGSGHPPDEFIACALAYRAARLASSKSKGIITDVTIRD